MTVIQMVGAGKSYYIQVNVTASTGSPSLSGITVTAVPTSGTTIYGATDSNGNATLKAVKNVTYTVTVSHSDLYFSSSSASVTVSDIVNTAEFTCASLPTVTVTVTDDSGSGYEVGRVISATDGTNTYTGTTDSNGEAVITLGVSGTFDLSMTNTPSGGSVAFTPSSVTASYGGTYTSSAVISFNWIYGVRITIGESDPETAVVYTDDCAGWTPMSVSGTTFSAGSWTTANKMLANIYPVMFDGTTVTKLKKTNLAQDENGNTVSTTTDKFTQIDKMYLDLRNDGTYIYVRISNALIDSNFSDWYFSYNGTVQECMRIGCYLAYNSGSDSYSRTGVTPTASVSLADFVTYMQNRGTGYDMFRWNQLIFVQALYLILFKSLDSQSALGLGYTSGSSAQTTGANDTLVNEFGMYGSTSSGTVHVSFLWIEDFWGNLYQLIGAMCSNSSDNLLVSDKSGTSTTGWTEISTGLSANIYGYIKTVQGTAKGGFCIKTSGSSTSTYYCDYGYLDASYFPYYGGDWGNGTYAGMFRLDISDSSSGTYSNIGSRISYSGA